MKQFDHDLGAIGLLLLFTALTVLLGVGLPVIKSEAPLKVSDWLGFAGNMIAAVFAGGAAVVAWMAAQRQIKHAALQNSVIAYGTLKEVLASMRADANANSRISMSLDIIGFYSDEPMDQSPSGEEPLALNEIGDQVTKLADAIEELRRTDASPWGNAKTRTLRSKLIHALSVSAAMASIQAALDLGDEETSTKRKPQSRFIETWGETLKLCREFGEALQEEEKRIYRLVDEHFSNFTELR